MDALHEELETEICASMLDSLNECIQISRPLLDENQMKSIMDEIKQTTIPIEQVQRGRFSKHG